MSAKDEMRERAAQARAESAAAQKKRDRMIAIIGASAIIAVVAAIGVYYVSRPSKPTCIPGTSICEDRSAALPATASATTYGVPAFPVKANVPTVEVYEDFQCPICGEFEPQNGKRLVQWAKEGRINLVWRPATFLDSNLAKDNAKNGNPDSSVRATSAFGCAVDAGKGTEYHTAIFAVQPKAEGVGYSDATLVALGAQAGITGPAKVTFDSCVAAGTYRQWAQNSYTQFVKNGMTGTPSVAINGKVQDNTVYLLNEAGTGVDTTGKKLWKALQAAGAK
jgi:protein-disulfide isomerase